MGMRRQDMSSSRTENHAHADVRLDRLTLLCAINRAGLANELILVQVVHVHALHTHPKSASGALADWQIDESIGSQMAISQEA